MKSELEIVAADGARKLVVVAHKPYVIDELDVRVVPLDHSVRVEPLLEGDLLHLDGEDLLCKELSAGEFVVIQDVRLRWLGSKPLPAGTRARTVAALAKKPVRASATKPPAAPSKSTTNWRTSAHRDYPSVGARGSARRTRGPDEPREGQRIRRKSKTNWLPELAITAAILVIAMFVVQRLSDSTWPHSPAHFVELAQAQYDNNHSERALETLAFALRDATGETRAQAVELEKMIRRMMLENASALQVSDARYQLELIKSFVARYLKSIERPAARECIRLCDEWLGLHRTVCADHSRGQPLLTQVEGIRGRFVTAAAPGSPETAADVIFAARSRMRFQWRDYKGAFATLDAFLSRNADNEEVKAERKQLLVDGDEWLQKQLRRLDRQLQRGDLSNAEHDLDKMEKYVVIPEWQTMIAERRARWQSQQ